MIHNAHIGCGQITWRNLPHEQALSDISQAGYAGAPAGPSPKRTPEETLTLYQSYTLKPAPGYLGADLWNPAEADNILRQAEAYGKAAQYFGCTELYVAAGGYQSYTTSRGAKRWDISGHVEAQDAMTDAEYAQFAKTLNHVGEITLKYGVATCFHNHVGSVIETREEVDQLFSLVDRDVVFMGPDTGHLAWAGADVLAFCRDYADSIKTIHIKDVNEAVMVEGRKAQWDYKTFSDKGIWTELGHGYLDFPAIFKALGDAGFAGWIIVETDVTQLATPLESAIVSRDYLKTLGL